VANFLEMFDQINL